MPIYKCEYAFKKEIVLLLYIHDDRIDVKIEEHYCEHWAGHSNGDT